METSTNYELGFNYDNPEQGFATSSWPSILQGNYRSETSTYLSRTSMTDGTPGYGPAAWRWLAGSA